MRKRSALAVTVLLGVLVLSVASPARSATKLRIYKGETSQGYSITFRVARTDAGRFIREMEWGITFTCEDQTTQDWGIGWGLANSLPVTDGAFVFDESFTNEATHLSGRIGKLRGSGTLTMVIAALTDDEQAQLCISGDLTWDVEFVRTIRRG
jgi:hypothetical protein